MDKIRLYIERTPISHLNRYFLRMNEIGAILQLDKAQAVIDAFHYGLAKGYRAGLATEQQKRKRRTATGNNPDIDSLRASLHEELERVNDLEGLRSINILVKKIIENVPSID